MKYIRLIIFSFLIVSAIPTSAQESVIGLGWSKNSVNTVVFRKNSLTTHNGIQYAAYYDTSGYVVLAKRKAAQQKWQLHQTQYKGNINDAHNAISIMVDGKGYLHIAWDHHNNKLNYSKGQSPGSLILGNKTSMTGSNETSVSYPEFYKLPNGNLIFLYRDGGSGKGNLVVNTYDINARLWKQLHSNLINGEGRRNAYWQACVDARGTIHLSWTWRETPDVASNHDVCYARSVDGGMTWARSTNEKYVLPVTEASAEYAARIPQRRELINQTSITTDEKGNTYIATYFTPSRTNVPQYHLIYLRDNIWKTVQISDRKTSFSLSGAGTKKIPVSRPQILADNKGRLHLLFRDVERGDKVSIISCNNISKNKWSTKDVTKYSVGSWEPTYDIDLWKNKKRLDIFVQKTAQGDGEKLEDIPPQKVSVIRWKK